MKHSFCVIVLACIILTLAGCKDQTASTNPPSAPVTSEPTSANEEPESSAESEFVIDVRTKEEWDAGHLEQAIRIPHEEITDKIASVCQDKSAKLVLY